MIPNEILMDARANQPPFWMEGGTTEYLPGTDSLARDELGRLLYGARISMVVGLVLTIITLGIGSQLRDAFRLARRAVDNLSMRLVNVAYAFPSLWLFIILQASRRETWAG